MTRPVFSGDDARPEPAACAVGGAVRLSGDEGRHAAAVRRIGAGESIDIVDGEGLRLTCSVLASDKTGLDLRVDAVMTEEEPHPRLTLVQALAKGGHDESAIDMCTQIGVDEVIPWQSDRAIVRWSGPKRNKGALKWRSACRAAAKQARRARWPIVAEPMTTTGLVQWVRERVGAGDIVLICHEEATKDVISLLSADAHRFTSARGVAVLIGPEGGISSDEIEALTAAGAELIVLGTNILRSSTAGAVVLALIAGATRRL